MERINFFLRSVTEKNILKCIVMNGSRLLLRFHLRMKFSNSNLSKFFYVSESEQDESDGWAEKEWFLNWLRLVERPSLAIQRQLNGGM